MNPPTEASYARLPGIGVTRESAAFLAPGTYWARVATALGSVESTWFGPVSFIVKA